MADWKPPLDRHQSHHHPPFHHPPPPPPAPPPSFHHQNHLPPPNKRARVSGHESPTAALDSSPPSQPPHRHPQRRASSPMRLAASHHDEVSVLSPSGYGPSPGAYHQHPPPPPDYGARRRSEMDIHHPGYGPPPLPPSAHTLEERMREQHMHNTTPPGHAYAPHHLDTSVGVAYSHPQPHSAPPYQPQSYPQIYEYGTPNGAGMDSSQKRKAVRASQACDNCRAKKAKCDEQKPCGNCVTNNVDCHFRDVQPPKQERSMLQLTETVSQLTHGFQTIEGRMSDIQKMLSSVVHRLHADNPPSVNGHAHHEPVYSTTTYVHGNARLRSSDNETTPASNHEDYQHGSYAGHNYKSESTDSRRFRSPGGHVNVLEAGLMDQPGESPKALARDLERRREEAQLDMLNGNVSLAPRHFTAANHLADWPSISPSFAGIARRDYVKRGEHHHSLDLRSITRKHIKKEQRGSQGLTESPIVYSEQDDASSVSNVSDFLPAMAFVKQGSDGSKGAHPTPGGRNPRDQSLSLDKETCYRLLAAYLDNIHIVQPFLSRQYVYPALQEFVNLYCSEPAQTHSPSAVVGSPLETTDSRDPLNNAQRRKFSYGPGNEGTQGKAPNLKIPLQRTAKNALLLLIFALGKACEHQGPLPALIGEVKTIPIGTPVPAGVICTPIQQPAGHERRSPAFALASHQQTAESNRLKRSHEDMNDQSDRSRNDPYSQDIDRIPGLAYYIHAAQILGEIHGENSLTNVQAQLLAGLYMSQLLRVNDGYRWICSACMTWQMLLKQRDDDVRNISEQERITFWACLVLESDIVAEHDCIQSGISKWEDQMRLPGREADPADSECRLYFMAQIHIRKILNRAHSALYTLEEDKAKNQEWQRLSSKDLIAQLDEWRQNLPFEIQWDENSPRATTINGARLRGKYWGARYVVFRNYLKDVLHPDGTPDQQSSFSSKDEQYKSEYERQREHIARATDCIEAAKASTVAFDGYPGMLKRLITTNPFGTAQAQFSNILVLCAAYNASSLHGQVQQQDILNLIDRTYEFLSNLAHLSPTMNTNLKVLERCRQRVLNENELAPGSAHTSFNA